MHSSNVGSGYRGKNRCGLYLDNSERCDRTRPCCVTPTLSRALSPRASPLVPPRTDPSFPSLCARSRSSVLERRCDSDELSCGDRSPHLSALSSVSNIAKGRPPFRGAGNTPVGNMLFFRLLIFQRCYPGARCPPLGRNACPSIGDISLLEDPRLANRP